MLCSQKVKACSYTIRQLSFQVTYKGQAMNLCSLLPAGTLECSNGITAGVTIKSFFLGHVSSWQSGMVALVHKSDQAMASEFQGNPVIQAVYIGECCL